jgi:hypothetical protein
VALLLQGLLVEARGEWWTRRLDLRRGSVGTWSAEWRQTGLDPLAPPDSQLDQLSPNAFGLRSGIVTTHEHDARPPVWFCSPGQKPVTLTAAWISVPDLSVRLTRPAVTSSCAAEPGGAVVRFSDADGFTADIEFDEEGLVTDYPGLARRLPGARGTL